MKSTSPIKDKEIDSAEIPLEDKVQNENLLPQLPSLEKNKSNSLEEENKQLKKEVEMLRK